MGDSTKELYLGGGRLVRSKKVLAADIANATIVGIHIPADTLVKKCWIVITTLFSGGTPSIDVGDSAGSDDWIDSTDITEGTVGAYAGSEANSPLPVSGKYYSAADQITITGSVGLTAGEAYVFAELHDVSDVIDD